MKTAGLRELKGRLSEYVRAVRRGETVLVTDRGEVVARIVPPEDRPSGFIARPAVIEWDQWRLLLDEAESMEKKPGAAAAALKWTREDR